ncbi:hypothetical protein SM033_00058 [Vibrio phage vB_VpaM_sm033]|nr:hypothetical protein SM033_00058 [Vibrio phage vB_VpaM_sm033]
MPAHTDFGASLTSHGPTKVFTQVKDNKRADFTIHGDDVQVVNGVILVDGKKFTAQEIVYSLISGNEELVNIPPGIHIGELLGVNQNYVTLACMAPFSGREELREINIKFEDHAIYHINLMFSPYIAPGETFTIDGTKYVALQGVAWSLSHMAVASDTKAEIVTTASVMKWLLEEEMIAPLGKNITIQENADSLLVVTKR